MFQSNTMNDNQACDHDEENTLGDGLLLTAAAAAATTTTTGSDKYRRIWRRSIGVGILVSIKRPPYGQESPQPSPSAIPYAPCPQEPETAVESEQSQHVIDVIPSVVGEEQAADEDRNKVVQIVKEKNFNSLKKHGGLGWVASVLGSNLEAGIDDGSQDQKVRWNTNDNPDGGKGFLYFFLQACSKWTIFLLLVSAGFAFAIDIMGHGLEDGWHDGVAILVAVVLLVAFPSVGNFYHERKRVREMLRNIRKLEVNVVRSGKPRVIAISDVVEGDLVVLKKDDRVPADGLFVDEGKNLVVDEVFNSKIDCHQNPFLFSGSKVVEGDGKMLVISVGNNTAMGKALRSVASHDPNEKTLLKARIDEPNDYNEMFAFCVTLLIALVLFIRLLCDKHHRSKGSPMPDLKGNVSVGMVMKIFEKISLKSQGKIWILTSALTAMVIGIQHGMPFVITISLYCWNKKVQIYGAEPQNLSACATMGPVTVICVDATGGLMCNQVEVSRFFVGAKDISNGAVDSEISQAVVEALLQGISVSVLVTDEISTVIPPINSLISFLGLNMEVLDQSFDILEYTRLSSIKKGRGVVLRRKGSDEKIKHLHWCGAASTILEMCSHYYDCRGQSHAMEGMKLKFEQMIKDMEDGDRLRPIAFAYRQIEDQELREEELNLLALVGLKYPSQEEIRSVVKDLRLAGVPVKLMSEDELSAVRAIDFGLGISTPGSNHVAHDGEEIRQLISSERMENLNLVTVIGSCLPENKLWMIQQLRKEGHIVAFFGGFTTTDTLALKEADVGITVRTKSTELARESSDITIKDFGSLFHILKSGRFAYYNIQKFIQLQLTICISGFMIALVTTMVSGESPITGLEMIWVNWVMCLVGSQMLLMELKSQEPAKGSLITKAMCGNIAAQVIYQVSVLLIFEFKGFGMNDDVRKTMIFNMFFLCQIFNQFNAMDIVEKQVLMEVVRSYCFLVTLAAVMTMQVVVIEYLGIVTKFVRLNAMQWGSCCIVAALSMGWDLALKLLADILKKWPWDFGSVDDSNDGSSNRWPRPYVPHFGVPFFVFLFHAMPGLFAIVNQYENLPVAYK
ncbi:calcium-transporting ATPase 12, plasma membrane-type-like [Corylus avellana]|uniref:calcium-transporting ATPase 12, plasma membrane-type-like n=1 Tax=Corylus avellana TaxID=13451 RepID=UPI001E1ED897|nr:calcium-transporting ATPase 12, plasma membrane-type-like [Corylus avellana]